MTQSDFEYHDSVVSKSINEFIKWYCKHPYDYFYEHDIS
ncbi:unnamed protein product, partial [marine sediment metagenome]